MVVVCSSSSSIDGVGIVVWRSSDYCTALCSKLSYCTVLMQMKAFNHDNVNEFVGMCINLLDVYVVTGQCHKGSLQVRKAFIT